MDQNGDAGAHGRFDDSLHHAVMSSDGSFTAYSETYGEHYHSTREGALLETFHKHVNPVLQHFKGQEHLRILDICFGLGFNTLATLAVLRQRGETKRIEIVAPELDRDLVGSLSDFDYPGLFKPFSSVIESISRTGKYEDANTRIEVLFGDAREILPTLEPPFDAVYHDAFSIKCNPLLWTREYFAQLARLTHEHSIVTTYSTALQARLALYENGFNVYLNTGETFRNATVASKSAMPKYVLVDMAHKIACNPQVQSLKDAMFG